MNVPSLFVNDLKSLTNYFCQMGSEFGHLGQIPTFRHFFKMSHMGINSVENFSNWFSTLMIWRLILVSVARGKSLHWAKCESCNKHLSNISQISQTDAFTSLLNGFARQWSLSSKEIRCCFWKTVYRCL